MPKYIVSQPAITLCIESRSSRSPTTTSAPISRNACARSSSFRTIARTALPCFKSSSVTVRPTAPTRPAAPVTRMGVAMFFPPCVQLSESQIDQKGQHKHWTPSRLHNKQRLLDSDLQQQHRAFLSRPVIATLPLVTS